MQFRVRSQRVFARLAAHAVALAAPSFALAGAAFNSGSATWSWDADTATSNGGKTTFTIAPPSSGSMPTSPTYQLSRTGSFGSATATGKGSVGYVANSTTASYTLAGGTGAAQLDPSDDFPGVTRTKVQFGGLFDPTGSGFGPVASGFFSLTVAGTAGAGGSTGISFSNVTFRLNNSGGALLRSAISDGTTFLGGGSGMSFSKTWTYSAPFSPVSVSSPDKIFVSGTLQFDASNHGTPSELGPFHLEAGGAPPTATCFIPGGNTGLWTDPVSWQATNLPAAGIFSFTEAGTNAPAVPNNVGDRARFVNIGNEPRSIELSENVTVGAIHIDDDQSLSIQQNAGFTGPLRMDVLAGEASIYVGSSFGSPDHGVNIPVELNDNLDVQVESVDAFGTGPGVLQFNNSILKVGGTPRNVTIRGAGAVAYNAANSYDGTTRITAKGTLFANAPGSLGIGPVIIEDGGLLVINDPNAIPVGGSLVTAGGSGGQIDLTNPPLPGQFFGADAGGVITGSPPALQALIASGAGQNLFLVEGAMIGHKSLAAGDDPQGLGITPLYIFGLSTSLDTSAGSITVGTATVGPYKGFGGDGQNHFYGGDPNSPTGPLLTILGSGDLVAVTGGVLTINGRLLTQPTVEVTVRGGGEVVLASNLNSAFGSLVVSSGATLRVNGSLPGTAGVTVQSGGTLGGDGNIGGPVAFQGSSVLDPGEARLYDNVTGLLTTGNFSLSPNTLLDFEFGDEFFINDMVQVNGDLLLDGELLIRQLEFFDSQETYTLFTYTGTIEDGTLIISPLSQDIFGVPAPNAAFVEIIPNFSGLGGIVVLHIPEPAAVVLITALGLFRRRRC